MQFALVNGERTAPKPKLSGTCPACGSPVIPRCGAIRVHHWAHRGERNCDLWWERETQWHRDWKNNFSKEFQEVVLSDDHTGEKHIADVRTSHALVIEFQHSRLHPDERVSREKFYGNMVWVVDGARLKGDLPRFLEGRRSFRSVGQGIFVTRFPQEVFPRTWLECSTPVFFDLADGPEKSTRNGPLYCLLPGRAYGQAVIIAVTRRDFVRLAGLGPQIFPAGKIVKEIAEALVAEAQARLAAEQARLSSVRRNYWRKIAFSTASYQKRSKPALRRRF